jgi:hypothetical protein
LLITAKHDRIVPKFYSQPLARLHDLCGDKR